MILAEGEWCESRRCGVSLDALDYYKILITSQKLSKIAIATISLLPINLKWLFLYLLWLEANGSSIKYE